MLQDTSRNRKLLAGVAGVTLALGLATGAGALPRPGDHAPVRTATISQVEELAAPVAPAARQPGDTAGAAPTTAPSAPVAVTQAPPSSTPTSVAKPTTTAPPTAKAPVVATVAPATAPATVAPVAAVAATSARAARRVPAPTEVQATIVEMKRQVGGLLLLISPTPAQIDQAGDQVCTAFDAGQSFAQVKATGLSMIPAAVTVPPATADWAVRKAVALYCPGHADKLA